MPSMRSARTLPPFWKRPLFRNIFIQSGALLALLAAVFFFSYNASVNLAQSSRVFSWDFLWGIASFELGSNWIGFRAGDPVYKALFAGVVNTLKVAAISVFFATILGVLVGIARLSSNPLASGLARGYIEIARNTPLLLQLFFWHAVVTRSFPAPRDAWEPAPGLFLTNRGFAFPVVEAHPAVLTLIAALIVTIACTFFLLSKAAPSSEWRQRLKKFLQLQFVFLIAAPAVLVLAGGMPISIDAPILQGFNFRGGASIAPEFIALLLGLVIYTASFIAEIVRGSILGVGRGQQEAATSLGLSRWLSLRKVILPQAMRQIVPPLGSQYLNIIKNSSLAVAIGYPDLVRVTTIVISETGHAIEMIAIMMGIYLTLSLITSGLVNLYNRSVMVKVT